MNSVRGTSYIRATLCSFVMSSRLSILLSLISYIYFGNYITARKVFIVTSYFNNLNMAMTYFWPVAITSAAEGYVSVKRIQEFMITSDEKPLISYTGHQNDETSEKKRMHKRNYDLNEAQANATNETEISKTKASYKLKTQRIINVNAETKGIVLENASAVWKRNEKNGGAGIRNINLKIAEKELCAIVGQVGAGKTTLLQVLLGELDLDSGYINVNGTVSYAAQEAWIFEGSIRNNIVFIEDFDEQRYKEVVKVCALDHDFQLFPHGDQTVVGERGISISGGQKARISLARAIYKQADIYLLDDPLSAVDTNVGTYIFEECIKNFLKNKICVLIAHQFQYLYDVKHMVLLNQYRIEAQGTYAELRDLNLDSLPLSHLTDESAALDTNTEAKRPRLSSCSSVKRETVEQDNSRIEQPANGAVTWSVYKSYFRAVNSRLSVMLVVYLFVVAQLGLGGLDIYVSQWVNWEERIATVHSQHLNESHLLTSGAAFRRDDELERRRTYVIIYSALVAIVTSVYVFRSFAFFAMCLRASSKLHDKIFRGVTNATMHFFNITQSGRILNRFAKDISNIDSVLPTVLIDSLTCFLEFVTLIAVVVFVSMWLLIPSVVMCVMIYIFRCVFIRTSRSVKRVESITLSPIYSHTNASLQGLQTIRSFNATETFRNKFHTLVDTNTGAWHLRTNTARAFAMWLDVVCLLYISTVTLSFVLFDTAHVNGGNIGLAILQCINMINICQWGVRQSAELENQMTSVERIMEYAELPSEPPFESKPKYRPPPAWPTKGGISFEGLNYKYSDDGEFVLKNINMCIYSKEKIGIVGRTGSGKSSIVHALFRLAKLDGVIRIDGIDTNNLGLHDLRQQICIIPQDPVLFSGSLRFNLDPFNASTDDQLWSALHDVELKKIVAGMGGGLDLQMSDGGSNFSMGQRQLVCLARAILRHKNILIMDEATANVDPETDRLIQATIRRKFHNCTVLTIAHRLNTIMDNDRVLVMDAGQVVEFGHPRDLLLRSSGVFTTLIDQTGPKMAAFLREAAERAFKAKFGSQNV